MAAAPAAALVVDTGSSNPVKPRDVAAPAPLAHFATLGHGLSFGEAALQLCTQANRTGRFAKLFCFTEVPDAVLRTGRWEEHRKYDRGYGLWFWKSATVQWLLNELPDGDVLFYADAGCEVNDVALWDEWFAALGGPTTLGRNKSIPASDLTVAADGAYDLLVFMSPWHEWQFTPGQMLRRFGLHPEEPRAALNQTTATYFGIRNGPRARRFINDWVELVANLRLLGDTRSEPNHKFFYRNMYDQSLFSLLVRSNLDESSGRLAEIARAGLRERSDYKSLAAAPDVASSYSALASSEFRVPDLKVGVLSYVYKDQSYWPIIGHGSAYWRAHQSVAENRSVYR